MDLLNAGMLEFTIASSPGMEGAVAVLAGIDAVKNGKIDANATVACPIASVTPDKANDPTVVIPWAVDAEAWASVISENAPEYAYFFE